jgi:hypothetical protein
MHSRLPAAVTSKMTMAPGVFAFTVPSVQTAVCFDGV